MPLPVVLILKERIARRVSPVRTMPALLLARRSVELLGGADEKPVRPTNVAEPIRVFISHYLAYELRAALCGASRESRRCRPWRT